MGFTPPNSVVRAFASPHAGRLKAVILTPNVLRPAYVNAGHNLWLNALAAAKDAYTQGYWVCFQAQPVKFHSKCTNLRVSVLYQKV
jgi:hypothetical protein